MLFESVVLAIIVGLILRGKLRSLGDIRFKHSWLIFLGLFLRYIPRLPFLSDTSFPLSQIFFIASYMFVITGISVNLKYPLLWIALIGFILNFTVVTANAGYMPVSESALISAGFPLENTAGRIIDPNHILSGDYTALWFLSDIFPIGRPYPFKKIISIGDIVMAVGVFIFILVHMKPSVRERKRSVNILP